MSNAFNILKESKLLKKTLKLFSGRQINDLYYISKGHACKRSFQWALMSKKECNGTLDPMGKCLYLATKLDKISVNIIKELYKYIWSVDLYSIQSIFSCKLDGNCVMHITITLTKKSPYKSYIKC